MNLNINQIINNLANSLDDYFVANPFVFKSSEASDDYIPSRPTIYKFIVPVCDMNEQNFPQKIPAIALVLNAINPIKDGYTANISAHIAGACSSITDKEIVKFNGEVGAWEFISTDAYTQEDAYRSLYLQGLLLGTEVVTALRRLARASYRIDNIKFTPPAVDLPDFPYIECMIDFDITYSETFRAIPQDYRNYL